MIRILILLLLSSCASAGQPSAPAPTGSCLTIKNQKHVVIENKTLGPCKGPAIDMENVEDITIQNNSMSESASGVYVLQGKNIKVLNNHFKNVKGPLPRGQFVQFNQVTGGVIQGNICVNELGKSNPEDAINLFKSDSIQVTGNQITGGGPSTSGGGILLGDGGGSNQTASGNTLVNPGQYGIGVAAGTQMKILNNNVSSIQQPWTNVGIYVWSQYSGPCSDIQVAGNKVKWLNKKGVLTNTWDAGNCKNVSWKGIANELNR